MENLVKSKCPICGGEVKYYYYFADKHDKDIVFKENLDGTTYILYKGFKFIAIGLIAYSIDDPIVGRRISKEIVNSIEDIALDFSGKTIVLIEFKCSDCGYCLNRYYQIGQFIKKK